MNEFENQPFFEDTNNTNNNETSENTENVEITETNEVETPIENIEENREALSILDRKFDQFFYVAREKDELGVWHELNHFGYQQGEDEADDKYQEGLQAMINKFKDALNVTLFEVEKMISDCDNKLAGVENEA